MARRSVSASKSQSKARRTRITPEDLCRFQYVSQPTISPDGSHIAFINKRVGERNDYESNVWITGTDGGGATQFTQGGRDDMPRWSPDGDTLAFVSKRTDDSGPQIYTIPRSGGEASPLTRFPEGSIRAVKWSPDGSTLAVAFRETHESWTSEAKKKREGTGESDPPRVIDDWFCRLDGDGYFDAQRFALYLVDVESGEHRCLYDKDRVGFFTFDFSPDGRRLAVTTNRDRRSIPRAERDEILIIDVCTGKHRAVPNLPEGPKTAVTWSPDGAMLAYAGRIGLDGTYSTENLELFVCDPKSGKARSLTGKTDYCLMALTMGDIGVSDMGSLFDWTPDSRRILFQLGWHGELHIASVSRRGGKVDILTRGRYQHHFGNIARSGARIAIARSSPTTLPEIAVGEIGRESIDVRMCTRRNASVLRSLEISKPTMHWVTSSDGTRVQTWVVMPPGFKPGSRRKYPAVLEIHGGPHGQYGIGLFHEFQVLAAAGYVVVYSNPRGSKGYGREFCASIRGDWGNTDWIDIQGVTEFMKSHPNIDTTRIGVMGGSYGGYMTNWAISHSQDYKAAITDRCVSNLVSKAGNSDYVRYPDLYWEGNSWDRPEALWNASPMKYFGSVKTPTLIIHSEGDLRCNIEQSEQIFSALKLRNIPTRFVRYPRSTSHGMSRNGPPDMRLHRLHQILDWWEKYLR